MICSICKNEIEVVNGWEEGHNAQPVNNGRCCGHCNMTVVLPTRLKLIYKEEGESDVRSR